MVNVGDCVAVFHSIHRVLKAEKILKEAGLDVLLIPVPRELSAECGMAIRFPRSMQAAVVEALASRRLAIVDLWLKAADGYSSLAVE